MTVLPELLPLSLEMVSVTALLGAPYCAHLLSYCTCHLSAGHVDVHGEAPGTESDPVMLMPTWFTRRRPAAA